MQTKLLDRVNYQLVSGAIPTKFGTFGIAYLGVTTPAGYYNPNTIVDGDTSTYPTANTPINYSDTLMVLSYGRSMGDQDSTSGKVAVGVNAKMYKKGFTGDAAVTGYTADGFSTDWGVMLTPNENVSYGAMLQNMGGTVNWSTGNKEEVESAAKLGGAWKLPTRNLLLTSDVVFALNGSRPMTVKVGTEWTPISALSLRAGLGQEVAAREDGTMGTDLSLSAGVGINVQGVRFDYAYKYDPTLADNSTHYVSVSFNPEVKVEKAAPAAPVKDDSNSFTSLTPTVPDAASASLTSVKTSKVAAKKTKKTAKAMVIDADLAELMGTK